MKRSLLKILFIFFLIISSVAPEFVYAQHKDSVTNSIVQSENVEDEEFNMFLMMLALAAVCFMAGCMLVGIIIVVLCLLLILAMVSFGIISVSVLAGYYKRSVSIGFKTFIMITSCLAGIIAGVVGFGVIANLFWVNINEQQVLLTGFMSGAIGGLLLGWAAYKIINISFKWGVDKLKNL